jgi:hypothetical protein
MFDGWDERGEIGVGDDGGCCARNAGVLELVSPAIACQGLEASVLDEIWSMAFSMTT